MVHVHAFLPGLLFAALLGAFATAAFANAAAPRVAWSAVAFLSGILGLFCASAARGVDPQTRLALLADGTPRPVEGQIVRLGPLRTVESASPFSGKVREEHSRQLDLRLRSVSDAPVSTSATVRVTVYAPVEAVFPPLNCGETLRATFAMYTEERFLDPGVWDMGEYLRTQGIGALGSAHAEQVSSLAAPSGFMPACRLHSLEQTASARLLQFAAGAQPSRIPPFFRLNSDDAAMLSAMLTGDRTWLRHRLRIGFERTGSFHLLVVSGLHLAIFSGVVFALARRLRLSPAWASLVTVACGLAYALFTGFGHPVQRALGMVTIYLMGRLLWRDRSAFNAIGLVALVMLAADPNSLLDSGMQMTLLSVIAIAGVAAPLNDKTCAPWLRALRHLREIRIDPSLPPRLAQFRVSLRMAAQHLRPIVGSFLAWQALPFTLKLALRIVELLIVSTTIEIFMMLPMAAYFHRVTLLALPVNLLIVPFLGLLLPCALATFAASLVAPPVAFLPAMATAALLHSVTRVIQTFAALPTADWRLPMPAPGMIVLWIALCFAAICLVRLRRFGVPAAIAALAVAAAMVVLPRPIRYHPGQLEITVIDVGQGDSLLVVTPQGKTLLIDAGGLVGANPDSNFDIGEDVVSPVLWSRGIRRLDAVAITHAHADHIGGMPAVLENFRPRELWIGRNPAVPSYDRVLAIAAQVGSSIKPRIAGGSFQFGGASFSVLAPASDYRPGLIPSNNDSLVLQATYGRTSALLEGDAEAPSESRMVHAGQLRSNLLKVGHHGSKTSTTPPFLAAVAPSYAVISVGRRNFYGHPRHEVLEELQSAHVKTFLTDIAGLTTFYLDGTGVRAETWASTRR